MKTIKNSVCLFLSALSFLYYLWLGAHNGFRMSVLPFWLLLSVLLLFPVFLFPKLPAAARRIFSLFLLAGTLFFLAVEGCILWGMSGAGAEDLDYIIIPGAGLNGEKPSSVLEKRLECALAYLKTHPGTKAVVSGGQGADESISEAESMKNWLLGQGISGSRILTEDRSSTTAENMRYSLACIAAAEQASASGCRTPATENNGHENSGIPVFAQNIRIGIATSNFHVFRALCIAGRVIRENGMYNGNFQISGMPADFPPLLLPHYMVREFFTVCVDTALGNMDPFPLSLIPRQRDTVPSRR